MYDHCRCIETATAWKHPILPPVRCHGFSHALKTPTSSDRNHEKSRGLSSPSLMCRVRTEPQSPGVCLSAAPILWCLLHSASASAADGQHGSPVGSSSRPGPASLLSFATLATASSVLSYRDRQPWSLNSTFRCLQIECVL